MSGKIDHLTVKQSGMITVTSQVPAWVWRCELCGWLGTGWMSESGAMKEGADHMRYDHGFPEDRLAGMNSHD